MLTPQADVLSASAKNIIYFLSCMPRYFSKSYFKLRRLILDFFLSFNQFKNFLFFVIQTKLRLAVCFHNWSHNFKTKKQ
jgi:hypothetical protein